MRDIRNGGDINVGGNFHINDNSTNEHKFLVHCSIEELLQERPFRQGNLKLEFKRKLDGALPVLGVAVVAFLGAAIWALFNEKVDLAASILGMGSLIVGYGALKATLEPNAFEQQERAALAEIAMILRSRRAE